MYYLNRAFEGTTKNEHKMWENLRLRFHCRYEMLALTMSQYARQNGAKTTQDDKLQLTSY
jgi:hypothetical protein